MIHETQFSTPSDLHAMCDLSITLRQNGLGAEHSGDLNWAAYMHSEMNPQRDTRLWWDGASLAAWATCNKYGLTFALSYAHSENLELLRRILAWAKNHARTLSPNGVPPETFTASCFASHLPHVRMLTQLGFVPSLEEALFVNTRSLSVPIPDSALPVGVIIRLPEGEDELDGRARLHATVWHPSKVTPEGYRLTRNAPDYEATLDMVAVMPDGSLAAYCICWPEEATGTCEFEPVGTHPNYRRKGLAGAVMYAAMRRAQELGMHTALVYCGAENRPFYQSLGFTPVDRLVEYVKPFEEV
ncbi:MAG: GNAT family N-acetyltransferase [Chloroflexi bacterium]|nr:GNAT family N-acetyltransferase [Chloroflexota bacterium]